MAKDYFQDITPPDGPQKHKQGSHTSHTPPRSIPITPVSESTAERSIRNIPVSARPRTRIDAGDIRESRVSLPAQRNAPTRKWLWIIAGISIVVLGVIALIGLRSTTVSVTPRSHTIVFDETARFVAYPADSAAVGTLSYTLETAEIEDSEVVPAQGTEQAADKASGTITVYNEYSTDTVKLIKNTRFETDGLIFRVPADVVVPGRSGTNPGQIAVTVIADAAGQQYNVGPIQRFTLPGLRSNADMYSKVYARSSGAMSGGFVGQRPGVAPADLASAKAAIRSRLESKVRETALSRASEATTVFPDLVQISYESLPSTTEAGGGVRIHERARVEIPLFPAPAFAATVAASVSADAGEGSVRLQGREGFVARGPAAGTPIAGTQLEFSLSGTADLIWNVDSTALAEALAGKDESAFEGVLNSFPSIQEAHARIEPFWKNTFPADPADIKIKVGEPALGQNA